MSTIDSDDFDLHPELLRKRDSVFPVTPKGTFRLAQFGQVLQEIEAETGQNPGYRRSGSISIAVNAERHAARLKPLQVPDEVPLFIMNRLVDAVFALVLEPSFCSGKNVLERVVVDHSNSGALGGRASLGLSTTTSIGQRRPEARGGLGCVARQSRLRGRVRRGRREAAVQHVV